MKKVITKIVFFIFFLNKSILNSQIPTELNHLSNIIAKRLAARAEIDLNYFDQNHISSVDLNKLFGNKNEALIMRSIWDINTPNQDTSELFSKKKNQLFSHFDFLKNKNLNIKKDYLLKLSLDSTGHYFNVWLNGLQSERSYRILYKVVSGSGTLDETNEIYDNDFQFDVTR